MNNGSSISRAGTARRRLAAPTLAMLPRAGDSLSFLYLDAVRVVQDDTGVCARVGLSGGGDRVYLPTAALSCVLLGPGTSITQPALATFARHGTTVVCAGSGAVRAYAGIQPGSLTTEWLERQVRAWTDDNERLAVATRMYERRFDSDLPPGPPLRSCAALRGSGSRRCTGCSPRSTGSAGSAATMIPTAGIPRTRLISRCQRRTYAFTVLSTRSFSHSAARPHSDSSTPALSTRSSMMSRTCTRRRSPSRWPSLSMPPPIPSGQSGGTCVKSSGCSGCCQGSSPTCSIS